MKEMNNEIIKVDVEMIKDMIDLWKTKAIVPEDEYEIVIRRLKDIKRHI